MEEETVTEVVTIALFSQSFLHIPNRGWTGAILLVNELLDQDLLFCRVNQISILARNIGTSREGS